MSSQSTKVIAMPLGAGASGAPDPVQVGLLVLGALVVDDVGDVLRRRCRGPRRRWRRARRPCRCGTPAAPARGRPDRGRRARPPTRSRGRRGRRRPWPRCAWSGRRPASGRGPSACRMRASISTLSMACARNTCCSTALTVWPSSSGSTARMCVGWCMYARASVTIGAGHGGGEQHRLPAGRDQPDDLLDVRQEAEVEHLVGLVEHEGAHVAEVEQPLLGQVEQPPGRTDDDLDPASSAASTCGS